MGDVKRVTEGGERQGFPLDTVIREGVKEILRVDLRAEGEKDPARE